jgi:putative flippase GtrA
MAVAVWDWLERLGIRILGWLGFPPTLARQIIRFVIVGGCAASTYVGVMALIVDGLGGRVLWGAFFAFVIATTVSFLGNSLWSFGARVTPGRAAKFFTVNIVGLGLNMLIAWLLERAGVHYLLISLAVLVVVPPVNFAGHRLYTFARS